MWILRLICCASILVAIGTQATAQEQPPANPKTGEQATQQASQQVGERKQEPEPALPEYVIQVTRREGCIVAPVGQKRKIGTLLTALPRPAKIQPDSAGKPITSTLFVWAKQEGEQWHVRVILGTGEFYDAGEIKAGDFKLNTNQLTSVPIATQHGLGQIKVGVLKIQRQQAGKPRFKNLTQSVSLESIDVNNLPDPFKVTLKNNSSQDLIAIQYNNFGRSGFLGIKWLSPGLLEPLIKAGESYKLEAGSEDNSCGDDEGYRPNQNRRIDLVSAVFADGTYEGEPGLPALIKGKALGNRKNLTHVVGSIRFITDPFALAQQLIALSDAMNEEADPYLIDTAVAMLPALPSDARDGLHSFIRSGMHEIKNNLQNDGQRLLRLIDSNPEGSKKWVERIKTKYERWLAAAEKMTSR
jgi:hypothetical protein